ncbi:MAG: hypothetical protein A2086_09865 [Spirochaetes bacterium GWD1_27_9]|nr:MAG: hypothetical protein A2Z98_08630 [Spirochaetes bacterium GWB1_27_13]OHD26521.1 MAG: hypothetical protein A2Y34_12865 [Spirochaetes bacterium GWC1_27_15]OHD42059.1 MAG: hypothetical protein A2086_09865 [Spirochaetes bacterium GWD1_27_9]
MGVDKNGVPFIREPIKITLSSYKNKKYLDVRKFYTDASGEWRPTQKGITLNGDIFEQFMDILTKHKDEIQDWVKDNKE